MPCLKKCPNCNCRNVKKNGQRKNIQHYRCKKCGKQFQSQKRKKRIVKALWKKYIWDKQTATQLAKKYQKSEKWINQQLNKVQIKKDFKIIPGPVVIIADMTFFKRTFGVCVFRAPSLKKNLIWKFAQTETISIYQELRKELENQGFKIQAVVVDGRPGLFKIFSDIPVQMCHFHQRMILTRYLTTRPKLSAGQELKNISSKITISNEKKMKKLLDAWIKKWGNFIKEKTINSKTGKWRYTHRKLRSAYRSIIKNLTVLYTYQNYPELKIPNTTNSLDGSFTHLKNLIRIHRGIKLDKKLKMIDEILAK